MFKSVPGVYLRQAAIQWLLIGSIMGTAWLLTYFPMGLLVAYFSRPMTNRYGENVAIHSEKYISQGSSGKWIYEATDMPVIRLWDNLEDGQRGEPSGKWSASCGGKEATFWNKYRWALRNPFNRAKRESRLLACFVNDCAVQFWGDEKISDKNGKGGTHFVRATDRTTGRVYYGYRNVFYWDGTKALKVVKAIASRLPWLKNRLDWFDNRVYAATFGYKIKPEHAKEVQDADDLDKAFTFRIQPFSKVN